MSIEAWLRRHRTRSERGHGPRVLDTALPIAWRQGTQSFYDDLHEATGQRACVGTACWSARGGGGPDHGVHCLGRCFEAPASENTVGGPIPRASLVAEPVILRSLAPTLVGTTTQYQSAFSPFDDYDLPDGATILAAVDASGLRGRGGAAFPTGAKWRTARDTPAPDRYVVCNGDEGDPGSFVDRLLLEEAPHAVLAGMLACARAIGASRGVVFIRGEYPLAATRVERAITEAESAGFLEGFSVRVVRGAGSYVAGEETALLAAIEGLRAEPRPKPPYPAQQGLEGLPTVVQNVETLAAVPWIVRNGRRADTKVVSLSGALAWTGVVEVALGTPIRDILMQAGGGPKPGRPWKMVVVGGPMGCVLRADDLDRPLGYDSLPRMGHGGLTVLDDTISARMLADHFARFAASESCGSCAPCRIGTQQLLHRPEGEALAALLDVLESGSLCGFGQGVPGPLRDLWAAFPEELGALAPKAGTTRRAAGVLPPNTLMVDGTPVPATGSLLEACRAAGADVPTLCHDHRVSAGGHCRLCMVEVDGRLQAACATPARPGTHVSTRGERLATYRRDLMELVLSESQPGGHAADLAKSFDSQGDTWPRLQHGGRKDTSHPLLRLDLDACVLCRLCVRACDEVQGQFVYSVEGRGGTTRLTWGAGAFADSPCVACGACAEVCPSGAITDRDRQTAAAEDTVVRTTCGYCGVGCQLDVHVADDRVQRIAGAPSPVNHEHTCVKGRYAHRFSRHPDRLTTPLIRRDGVLQPATWDEAISLIAQEFSRLAPAVGLLSSARCTNEENYLAQKWFRTAFHTHNIDCCARVCHGPTAAGMRAVLGTGAATNSLADLEHADLILASGTNATDAHPVTGARIKQATLRGAKLIVIDPRRTELAQLADIHLQLRPGTNVPLLNSIAAAILDEGLENTAFLAARAENVDALRSHLQAYLPEVVEPLTGVPADLVRRAARAYATATHPLQVHGLGMTEHHQGSEGVMLLCNLALLVGAIGREGVGVNPLRGQNNVQGAADMGCQPDRTTGYLAVDDPSVQAKLLALWGHPLSTEPGLMLPDMYHAARAGQLKALYIIGEDVVQTDPDAHSVVEALDSLEFLVVQELFLTRTAQRAHVVLPGASFLEKDGTFTNGERRVQRVRAALPPVPGARPDWQILMDLMAASGVPQPFTSPAEIMNEIGRVAPSFAGIDYAGIDAQGLQWPALNPGQGTPILHASAFPTADGKAHLAVVDFVPSPSLTAGGDLLLITGRALEHYNCGSMTRRGEHVVDAGLDTLQIHPRDSAARGIHGGQVVQVRSAFGEARGLAEITDRVPPGVVFMTFHFPESETNRVTSNVLDRVAGCPEYKLVPVEVGAL